jgi:hypothetical protein
VTSIHTALLIGVVETRNTAATCANNESWLNRSVLQCDSGQIAHTHIYNSLCVCNSDRQELRDYNEAIESVQKRVPGSDSSNEDDNEGSEDGTRTAVPSVVISHSDDATRTASDADVVRASATSAAAAAGAIDSPVPRVKRAAGEPSPHVRFGADLPRLGSGAGADGDDEEETGAAADDDDDDDFDASFAGTMGAGSGRGALLALPGIASATSISSTFSDVPTPSPPVRGVSAMATPQTPLTTLSGSPSLPDAVTTATRTAAPRTSSGVVLSGRAGLSWTAKPASRRLVVDGGGGGGGGGGKLRVDSNDVRRWRACMCVPH